MQSCSSPSSSGPHFRSPFAWPRPLRQLVALSVLSLLAAAAFPVATFAAPGSGC